MEPNMQVTGSAPLNDITYLICSSEPADAQSTASCRGYSPLLLLPLLLLLLLLLLLRNSDAEAMVMSGLLICTVRPAGKGDCLALIRNVVGPVALSMCH
jgi:hypothetical protein